MPYLGNSLNNSMLASLSKKAGQDITFSIHKASAKTGVNFAYLMEQAAAESSFDPEAQAKTSSAAGLYQFIERTWMNLVRDHGEEYGMGDYAKAIDDKGRVSDPALRKEILDLRFDPEKASAMAAELAAENKAFMERHIEGEIGSTELYFAHFMGAGKATAFLEAREENPLSYGADLFPKEARANRNVFYDAKTQKPKTLEEIYAFFDKKFSVEDSPVISENVSEPAIATNIAENFIPMPDSGPRQYAAADPWAAHSAQKLSSLNALSNRLSTDLSQWLIIGHLSDGLPLSPPGANGHS